MSKNKILFHYSMLNVGGAEKSVLKLINALSRAGWEVTLVLNTGSGALQHELDVKVKQICFFPKPWKSIVVNQKTNFKKLLYLINYSVPIVFYTILTFLRKSFFSLKKYDAAIISLQGLDPSFVCNHVKSNKKYLYLRSDLRKVKKKKVSENILKFNNQLDGYLCVSNSVLESLDSIDASFKDKANVLYNIVDVEGVKELSFKIEDPYKDIRELSIPILVTVCRMSDVSKGLFRKIDVAIHLKNEGIKFKWFFIGDGLDLNEFKHRVKKEALEDCIFTLGEKENPYPYIKYADVVCVLSKFEGLSGVVNESKFLGKALIATEFSGINEQIVNKKNGLIVENNTKAIIKGLKELIKNKDLRKSLENNFLGSQIDDNEAKILKLEKLIKN